LGDEAGDDGVKRPLVRFESVGVLGIEAEQGTSVLQGEPQVRWNDSRTEPVIDALDERHCVSIAVDHR